MHSKPDTYAEDAPIDLKRLGHFVLLAEERNFSRAAERAHLSQTAFSRSIQALEQALGLRLFDRSTRSMQITAAGSQVLSHARKVLATASDLKRETDNIVQADGGELRFGASLLAVDSVLPGVLTQLMTASPRLRIDLKVGQWRLLQEWLEQDRIELFVGHPGPLGLDENFDVTPLSSQSASIFCRADHPLCAPGARPALRDVLNHPWATVQVTEGVAVRVRRLFGLPGTAALPATLACDNLALLREAVLNTDTLLLSWHAWLRDDLAQGRLVDLGERLHPTLPPKVLQLDCAIVQRTGRTASPGARRLMEIIRAMPPGANASAVGSANASA